LLLTVVFVMVAEVLIYVPSIANFRLNWLNDRIAAAHTAGLVLDAAPSGMVPESLARQVLDSIGARTVAIKMGTQRRLLATAEAEEMRVVQNVGVRDIPWYRAIVDACRTLLFCAPNDAIRVVGPPPMAHGDFLEVVLFQEPLCRAMWSFS